MVGGEKTSLGGEYVGGEIVPWWRVRWWRVSLVARYRHYWLVMSDLLFIYYVWFTSDLLGVTEPCATPNLCWLILVGRMREETGFKTYLWLFGYSIKPCLGSPCTFLGLQSPQSPGHLLSLQDFLLHALLENFLHITSKSVKSQGILPSGCRMSFIKIFCIEKAILFQNYM